MMNSGDSSVFQVTFEDKEDVDFVKKCELIASDIKTQKLSVLNLIEHLGSFLTSESHLKRETGVSIISEVLTNLPSNSLNSQQITVIASYLCEKSKDHHQVVVASLKGILALVKSKNVSSESIISLLNSIFQNVTCQQQQQPHRYIIYEIFEAILQNHLSVVKSLGLDFVYGIISAIDGERDPKNLIYLFNWIRILIKNVSLAHLSEEMFEVLACYFPVDFKAPTQDPNRITREALSEALCPCLTAIPEFAEYCIPLALEKLDSSLKIAKLDSLKLLKHGCQNFNVSSYIQHASELWSQLQKEVLNNSDLELQKECLETFSTIINKLSTSDNELFFANIVNDVVDTLRGNLVTNSKMFTPSALIITSLVTASKKSADLVIKRVGPLLENTFSITNNIQEKILILNTLVEFFKAFSKHNENSDISKVEELVVIPILCLQSLTNNNDEDLRTAAFQRFTDIAEFVPENVRSSLLDILHIEIINKRKDREALLQCLKKFASVYETEIKNIVLYKEQIKDISILDLYLEALNRIIELNNFTDTLADTFLNYLLSENICVSKVTLKNIRKQLSNSNQHNSVVSKSFLSRNLIQKLIEYVIRCQNTISADHDYLTDVSCVLKMLVGCEDKSNQSLLVQKEFINIENHCNGNQSVRIALLNGILVRIDKNVVLDYRIIEKLVELCIDGSSSFVKDNALQLLANLLNKMVNESVLENKLKHIQSKCLSVLEHKNNEVIILLSWVTKALLMRNHNQADIWLETLINLLEKYNDVALGFRIIMNDSYEDLNCVSHCNKTLLYRQKCFILTTNKIKTLYLADNVNYLNAVGYLIENAPKQAVTGQFQKIFHLVINCLEKCSEPEVLCVLLDTLETFIINEESIIEDNLEELVMKILLLSGFESSMKVRISALRCLKEITQHIRIYKMLPFKKIVIDQLGKCLDDKKRLVRKQAMETRLLWFLIDAPLD